VAGDDQRQASPLVSPGSRSRRVVVIGLTGGLAAGKSTALAFFAEFGALTLASDRLVGDLYRRPEVKAALRARFGEEIFAGQDIDKRVLGEIVTQDSDALHWLEGFVHPLVGERLRAVVRKTQPGCVVVCEVPLLFESRFEPYFDLIVSVEAPVEVRQERWRSRDRASLLDDLEKRQLSSDERAARADLVYVNDGDLEGLRTFVAESYRAALALMPDDRPAGSAQAASTGGAPCEERLR
jgi:dephospho-CoA kinase